MVWWGVFFGGVPIQKISVSHQSENGRFSNRFAFVFEYFNGLVSRVVNVTPAKGPTLEENTCTSSYEKSDRLPDLFTIQYFMPAFSYVS
jgi:hypothetical protein